MCVCVSVRSFLPPSASRFRNVVTYVYTATRKNFNNVIFAKNAWFRSYSVICLPRMPPTTLKPQTTDTKGKSAEGWKLIVATLTKNASFRSFAYLLRAHIRNINMLWYITSARGHELRGRVRAHAYNYYAWAECAWVAKVSF